VVQFPQQITRAGLCRTGRTELKVTLQMVARLSDVSAVVEHDASHSVVRLRLVRGRFQHSLKLPVGPFMVPQAVEDGGHQETKRPVVRVLHQVGFGVAQSQAEARGVDADLEQGRQAFSCRVAAPERFGEILLGAQRVARLGPGLTLLEELFS
jgi:hypothetical protein